MKTRFAGWVAIGMLYVAAGCHGTPRGAGSVPAEELAARDANPPLVPAQAPDTIPDWLFALDNVWEDRPGLSGRYVKNAVSVLFMPGSTVGEKSAAIASVHGRVVGGFPQVTGEGLYYVTLPPDSTTETMLRAVDDLNRSPQVAGATVVFAEAAEDQLDDSASSVTRVSKPRSSRP